MLARKSEFKPENLDLENMQIVFHLNYTVKVKCLEKFLNFLRYSGNHGKYYHRNNKSLNPRVANWKLMSMVDLPQSEANSTCTNLYYISKIKFLL